MMGRTELCTWLRANSSGIYKPAAEAADEIEHLALAGEGHFQQAMENGRKANARRLALERIAKWDHRGKSVAENYDDAFGEGEWARLLGSA